MKKDHLGEFEELVLLITTLLKDDAYGLAICDKVKEQTGRVVAIGAVHATIARLEAKGYVTTTVGGSTNKRGGRRKRLVTLTSTGRKALVESRDTKLNLWTQIPELTVYPTE